MSSESEVNRNQSQATITPLDSNSQDEIYYGEEYHSIIGGLKDTYNNKIKPLETTYNFEGFHSPPLTDSDIEAKPIVLLMGQYSTGKTSFIKYLIEKEYPGKFYLSLSLKKIIREHKMLTAL